MKKLLLLVLFTCTSYAAFSTATVSQRDWRWRKDDGDEATATWSETEDQALSKSFCADETFRLRMSFFVESTTGAPAGIPYTFNNNFRISYATDVNGTFTPISAPSASGGVHFVLSGSTLLSSGTSTTKQLSTTDNEGVGFIPGTVIDSNTTNNIGFTTPNGSNSVQEFEWLIAPTENAQAQTYYFKLTGLNGTYATLPSLTITNVTSAIDNTVSLNNETLTAANASATYQWVDCNSGEEISGETDQSYTPTESGSYAVIVTDAACGHRKSVCTDVTVTVTGINNSADASTMLVHPNPSNGNFVFEATKTVTLEIYSPAGQLVFNKTLEAGSHPINLDAAGTGIYFLTATDANGNRTSQKIVLSK